MPSPARSSRDGQGLGLRRSPALRAGAARAAGTIRRRASCRSARTSASRRRGARASVTSPRCCRRSSARSRTICARPWTLKPIFEAAPLAQALRLRFPVVQGPMTRVSDSAEFAAAVADGGALPMVAFALLKGDAARAPARGHEEAARRPPVGHRPARLRAAGAARRAARLRHRVQARLRDHRRRPSRPGGAPRGRRRADVPARPLGQPDRAVPARRRAALHLRGARMRRPHRPAEQLRAVERDGRSARRRSLASTGRRPARSSCSLPAASTTPRRRRCCR